jgi:hypothetical protein
MQSEGEVGEVKAQDPGVRCWRWSSGGAGCNFLWVSEV